MGYYIQAPSNKGKANFLVEKHGGEILTKLPLWADIPKGKSLIMVVDNGPFEAAAWAYSEDEYNYFVEAMHQGDRRPRTYVLIDTAKARELT